MSSLVRVGSIAGRMNCGYEFWRRFALTCEKVGGAEKISLAGWEKLLEIAREEGLVAFVMDEKGNQTRQLSSMFSFALLQQWRRVQRAKAEGWTPAEFARRTSADIDAEHLGFKSAQSEYDKHRANVQRENADRFSRTAQRTRRAIDDDDVIV